jgi:hypothetical protein
MGRLLWAIQAWSAEMENGERAESIRPDKPERGRKESTWGDYSGFSIAQR